MNERKKYTLLLLWSFLFSQIIQAQDTIPLPETTKATIDTLVPKKDTIYMQESRTIIKSETPANPENLLIKDSLKQYIQKDHVQLAALDSLWKKELYSHHLYDTIYKSVQELTYEPIVYPELSTDTLKARLARLDARTPFNISYNPSLESVIKSYLKNRREHLERLMSLSDYYFPLFEQELDNQDIPLEVKYLAVVESALKPRAKSRVGATGLWQFMFGTGKEYDLDVSSYVDERMDPIKATTAAAKYLARLYKIFGDWDLALASYNSGPGNVTKAIRRSGGYTNYWNIRSNLPRETAGYLPAFLANMYIFEYAEEHGFEPKRPQYAYFETDTVQVKQLIKLDQVAELMDIKIEELQFLNPSYKLDIIPFIPKEKYTLRLPLDKVGKFVNREKEIYAFAKAELDKQEKPLPQLFNADSKLRYRVKSGDYLGKIARKYGVRVSQLKQWNGLRSNNLKIGQRLTIYPRNASMKTVASKQPAAPKKKLPPIGPNTKTYRVKSGDTLWSISKKITGVSIDDLRKWNDISGSRLKPGMVLRLSKE